MEAIWSHQEWPSYCPELHWIPINHRGMRSENVHSQNDHHHYYFVDCVLRTTASFDSEIVRESECCIRDGGLGVPASGSTGSCCWWCWRAEGAREGPRSTTADVGPSQGNYLNYCHSLISHYPVELDYIMVSVLEVWEVFEDHARWQFVQYPVVEEKLSRFLAKAAWEHRFRDCNIAGCCSRYNLPEIHWVEAETCILL